MDTQYQQDLKKPALEAAMNLATAGTGEGEWTHKKTKNPTGILFVIGSENWIDDHLRIFQAAARTVGLEPNSIVKWPEGAKQSTPTPGSEPSTKPTYMIVPGSYAENSEFLAALRARKNELIAKYEHPSAVLAEAPPPAAPVLAESAYLTLDML